MKYFNLSKKNVFVVGGSGLIGHTLCKVLTDLEGNVFNLDILDRFNKNVKFIKFDASKRLQIEKKLNLIFKKYGTPDVLVNCSYPASKDWSDGSFLKIKQKTIGLRNNLFVISM